MILGDDSSHPLCRDLHTSDSCEERSFNRSVTMMIHGIAVSAPSCRNVIGEMRYACIPGFAVLLSCIGSKIRL